MSKKIKKNKFFAVMSIIFVAILAIFAYFDEESVVKKQLAIETEYSASSPLGAKGGIVLPASCASNAWNNNSGYHLVAPLTDPGNCNTPTYNCETGSLNPALGIVSNHSLLGVALNSATRWYTNIWGGAGVGGCFYNNSGQNIFVPTATQPERNSFLNALPAGVSKANGGW